MRCLAVVLALAACGSNGHAPVKAAGSAAVALPVGPPLVTPGERMAYRLSLRGIELGTFGIGVGEVEDVAGMPAIVVQAQARTSGLASVVAGDIDDRFTSWIDVTTGRPRRFEVFEHAGRGSKDKEHVVVDFAARARDAVPVHVGLNDAPLTPQQQKVTQADVWDYNAYLMAVRSWEGAPGSTISLEVFRSSALWRIDVTMGASAPLVTELGELPALRFEARAQKLARDGSKFPGADAREVTLWISDDDGRVPLKLVAKTDYGGIEMNIVDYQPGTGERLRK